MTSLQATRRFNRQAAIGHCKQVGWPAVHSRFNKICHPSQRPRWQVDKEAIGLSRDQQRVTHPPEIYVSTLFLNMFTLLAVIQTIDNLFHSVAVQARPQRGSHEPPVFENVSFNCNIFQMSSQKSLADCEGPMPEPSCSTSRKPTAAMRCALTCGPRWTTMAAFKTMQIPERKRGYDWQWEVGLKYSGTDPKNK